LHVAYSLRYTLMAIMLTLNLCVGSGSKNVNMPG